MAVTKFLFTFAVIIFYRIAIMLGVKTRRAPISGDIANHIRDAVVRVATGQLNEREKASVERTKKSLNQCKVTWIGLDGKEL